MSERTDGIASELLTLQNKDGKIIPVDVVKWARRNKRSRLHAALEWDDEIAGEKYRVWQVRELIAVYVVEDDGARRFVSLSIDRVGGGYRSLEDIRASPNLRAVMLEDALHELERVQRKYTALQELTEVWDATRSVRRRVAPQQEAAA